MLVFGTIAEGPTDQVVLENILTGHFRTDDEYPFVNPVEPPRPLTEKPGGWGHVFKALERKRHEEALHFNDCLVIHIDTDVQEEYGVPSQGGGKELPVREKVDLVIAKLKEKIDADFYKNNADRIVFAVAVDSIECWLLPLYDAKKADKTTKCLKALDEALRKRDIEALSAFDDGDEKLRAYDTVSSGYRKRKTLAKFSRKNPSLELFIERLDPLKRRSATEDSGGSQRPT